MIIFGIATVLVPTILYVRAIRDIYRDAIGWDGYDPDWGMFFANVGGTIGVFAITGIEAGFALAIKEHPWCAWVAVVLGGVLIVGLTIFSHFQHHQRRYSGLFWVVLALTVGFATGLAWITNLGPLTVVMWALCLLISWLLFSQLGKPRDPWDANEALPAEQTEGDSEPDEESLPTRDRNFRQGEVSKRGKGSGKEKTVPRARQTRSRSVQVPGLNVGCLDHVLSANNAEAAKNRYEGLTDEEKDWFCKELLQTLVNEEGPTQFRGLGPGKSITLELPSVEELWEEYHSPRLTPLHRNRK